LNERISQLKPPGGLDFDSTDLSQVCKCWNEEITLDNNNNNNNNNNNLFLAHYIKKISMLLQNKNEKNDNETNIRKIY